MGVQVISHEGKPEYAVVPWQQYLSLLEAAGQPAPTMAETPAPVAADVTQERPALDRLAALREAKGLALESLARTVGISPSYLGMIERGERLPDAAIQRSLAWELGGSGLERTLMSVRISRQQWDGLLAELDHARRQRHLLTYRALLERLQLPSPAMQTLTAALEYLAVLDARAEQPLRSSLVISQGAESVARTGFFECVERLGRFSGPSDGVAAASWHASEVARVFEHSYPHTTGAAQAE